MTRNQARSALAHIWNELVQSEPFEPPESVVEWANLHIGRLTILAVSTAKFGHPTISRQARRIEAALKGLHQHHQRQATLLSRKRSKADEQRLTNLRDRNQEIRNHLLWLETELKAEQAFETTA